MYLSGMSFYVLADDFLVHQNHAYLEEARRQEVRSIYSLHSIFLKQFITKRRYNRKIYINFREELCLKYLTQHSQRTILIFF